MPKLISQRGDLICRGCGSRSLKSVLDLGAQPLPSEYGNSEWEELDRFPLHMRICSLCGLGQLGEYVLPERIFHEKYPYLSSASKTWIEHSRNYAKQIKSSIKFRPADFVLEIASNDGYLLSEFKNIGIQALGVEPAKNVAKIANNSNIKTISDFFSTALAAKILADYGHPKLVVANNVFAHIPDMHDFTEGLSILSSDETIITIENPSLSLLLKNTLFDTIYHEHYSYLTAHSVRKVAQAHDLELFHVDHLQTHGGSNRYWLSRLKEPDDSVQKTIDQEIKNGLFNPEEWMAFALRSKLAIDGLSNWLDEREASGDIVVGYGAAHKGNTFLNAVGENAKILKYVVDASPEKQGKFLPGSKLRVLSPKHLASSNPTDVLILPWNIAEEITQYIKEFVPKARIWVAQPKMERLY